MTYINDVNSICPNCKQPVNFTAYNSINVSLDPELRTNILNGTLRYFVCNNCNHACYKNDTFYYHDMDNKFILAFSTDSSIRNKMLIDYTNIEIDSPLSKFSSILESLTNRLKEDNYLKKPIPVENWDGLILTIKNNEYIYSNIESLKQEIYNYANRTLIELHSYVKENPHLLKHSLTALYIHNVVNILILELDN